MTVSLMAVDYSRPIQTLFEQAPQIGIIHSVFQRAMNIVLADTILAVLSDELPRMPNGVRLLSMQLEGILRNLCPGMEVLIGHGRLFIPLYDISFYLTETPLWEPRPAVEMYRWRHTTVAQHMCLLAHYLAAQQQRDGLASLAGPLLLGQVTEMTSLGQIALPRLRRLAQASYQQDHAAVESAVRGLAGLGPGLTPAGDDALAGFISVMVLLSPLLHADTVPGRYIAEIIAAVAEPRTTILSAVLLAHAARGEVAEQLGKMLLVLALPAEKSETVLHMAKRLLAFGATSGSDTLLGVLLGLRTLGCMVYSSETTGSEMKKVDPCPSTDSNQTRPPCCSINSRQRYKPRPVPPIP